jgi:hypothetical protein
MSVAGITHSVMDMPPATPARRALAKFPISPTDFTSPNAERKEGHALRREPPTLEWKFRALQPRVSPAGGEPLGDCGADTARASRYQGHHVLQFHTASIWRDFALHTGDSFGRRDTRRPSVGALRDAVPHTAAASVRYKSRPECEASLEPMQSATSRPNVKTRDGALPYRSSRQQEPRPVRE